MYENKVCEKFLLVFCSVISIERPFNELLQREKSRASGLTRSLKKTRSFGTPNH